MTDCLFCKIIKKDLGAEIVYENEQVLAFKDIDPKAPTHILIIPKKHIAKVADLKENDYGVLGEIFKVANKLAQDFNLIEQGFRLVVNNGEFGGQAVYHLHFHLLGGRQMHWPPG